MSFNLGDYEDVAHRLARFHQQHPDGRIIIAEPRYITLPDERTAVLSTATVYRGPDDPIPAVEHSVEPFPGRTPYTRDSEAENAATSALGRALRLILPDPARASRQEVQARHTPTAADYANRAGTCTTIAELRNVWTQAQEAGVIDDQLPDGGTLSEHLATRAEELAENTP